MGGQPNKFKIGLFVVTSLLLATGMLIWLGASRYFEPTRKAVAYFSESVQGLEPDSPVKFRGVTVGRVYSIKMAPDARHVEVVMTLDKNFELTEDLGVRADHLGLTGMKYLEMDRYKKQDLRKPAPLNFKPPYPRITAYPSELRQFGNEVGDLFRKVNAVDIDQISRHLLSISAKLDKMISDPRVDNTFVDAADAVKKLRQTATKLNSEVDRMKVGKRVARTLDKSAELFQELTKTATSANQLVKRTDFDLKELTQKLNRAADDLMVFTRRLKEAPLSTLLRGAERGESK